ncbi:MAG: glycosyl transferase [Chthoniobacterales bacterium]|nr:MAG: glycosyl transferase [Chthoniobacterales bacterium]
MFISVIIPSYNRSKTLKKTIESVLAIDYPPNQYELIVVDNCSTDDTRQVVEASEHLSDIKITYLFEVRPGVHFARNMAIKHAAGTWLYYTDDDMVVDSGVFKAFEKLLRVREGIAVASGQVLPIWTVEPPPWVTRIMQNSLLSLQLREEVVLVSPRDPGVYSCHQFVRKDVLVDCGGFDPENTAGEWVGDGETGLNLRIEQAGHFFGYTSEARAFHLIPPERMTQRWLNQRFMNQACADVFTSFRDVRPDIARLRRDQIKSIISAARALIGAVLTWVKRSDGWRVKFAKVYYEYGRHCFLERLLKDPKFRDYVLKESFLDD